MAFSLKKILIYSHKTMKFLWSYYFRLIPDYIVTYYNLYVNNVQFKDFRTTGIPHFDISLKGKCEIGATFIMCNLIKANPVGGSNKCYITVRKNAHLKIGSNVGISSATIYCQNSIEIGNNVKIGGGVIIYDTDFHSLNPLDRRNCKLDMEQTKTSPVKIEDDVFIGAHAIILKGVIIGKNSIIGARSVVTENVPENEIWAGSPAKYVKKIEIK